jgi:bis(5'-nucleosyl)-tetraphosphatase (symmetrical)
VAVYVIGDVQGCFDELQELLRHIEYRRGNDELWFVGDLVNRGPKSLEVLRFVAELGSDTRVVLGNHDLNLLAIAAGVRKLRKKDTVQDVLDAPDGDALMGWLSRQPLLMREPGIPYTMVHAGLPPEWDVAEAQRLAREVESALAGEKRTDFFRHMYGNQPARWNSELAGWDRLRFITNALTRIRFVDTDGNLDMAQTGPPGSQPATLVPWFEAKNRRSRGEPILFGHWATLRLGPGLDPTHRVYHLDTGCVWGGRLTALRLDDERYFSVPDRHASP